MKKTLYVLVLGLVISLMAAPAFGQGRMDRRGMHYGYYPWQGTNMGYEKMVAAREAWDKHYEETAPLRRKIFNKRHEMMSLLSDPKTKLDVLTQKQSELQKMLDELERRQLEFRWTFYQNNPELAPDPYQGCFSPGLCLDTGNEYEGQPYAGYGPMMGPGSAWRGMMNHN